MRITIIPSDSRVVIDGVGHDGINLSSIDPSIHAIQWYGTDGEIEIKDYRGRSLENKEITSFDEFAFVIPLWEAADAVEQQKKAEFEAMQLAHAELAIAMEAQAKAEAEAEAKRQAELQAQQ